MEIITTHLEADFDGIASMVAAGKLYPDAHLVLPGGAQSRERAYLAQHPLPLTPVTDFSLSDVSKIILVDADHQDRLGPLEKALENEAISIHIWDHHPLEPTNALAKRANFLKLESIGATITLLVEALQEQSISWSPEEATLFAIALYEETGHFTFLSTTARDLQVGARLIETGRPKNGRRCYSTQMDRTPSDPLQGDVASHTNPHLGETPRRPDDIILA